MEAFEHFVSFAQSLVILGNLGVMLYTFKHFLAKPHDTLEARIIFLEGKVKEHDDSLKQGNDNFRKQQDFNEVFINCMLAFIDFEIAYCHHTGYEFGEDIERARDTLQHYLAKK